ncbi:MAG: insulinase family protein [Candidatus Obscuribacterales bacterium]|nr:insulinase family protein [Candidatus Obscuribacterales bacterium]
MKRRFFTSGISFCLRLVLATAVTWSSTPAQAQQTNESGETQEPPSGQLSLPAAGIMPANKDLPSNGKIQEFTLDNGLKVLILECPEFPLVSNLIWYRVGSRDEETGSTGLSHLVEHLLFQKVGSYKTGEIGSTIARNGGQFNGYTSDDFTTFFETLPANKLELALKIESERMRNAKFSAQDVAQEVSNISKELDTEQQDPSATLAKEVRAMMFMQHPYHNPTIGWRSDLENIKLAQAKNFYDRFYHPNNATLVIAGNVHAKDAMLLVQKYFAAIPRSLEPIKHVSVAEPLPRSERRVSLKYGGKQELMQIAFRSPAISDNDAAAMLIIEKVLSNNKLKTKFIDSKICSNANASYEIKKEPGLFTITFIATPATANAQQKILDNADSLLSQLKEKPLTEQELRRAKNAAEFAFFSECEGPYRAGFHLGYFDTLDSWKAADSWATKIRSINSADVLRVAKRYFSNDARVIGWIAGTQAPKPAVKVTPPAEQNKEHDKNAPPTKNAEPKHQEPKHPAPKHPEHVRLTGYKTDDSAAAPVPTKKPLGKLENLICQRSSIDEDPVHKRVLKNGLTVYVFESHISPIIQINGSLNAGDIYCSQDKCGLSALAAATLNQGSNKRNKAQMQSLQEDLGIPSYQMLKFEAGPETIDFQTRCLARDLNNQLDLLAETTRFPNLDESNVEKAKQEALAISKRDEEVPRNKAERALLQNLLAEKSPFQPTNSADKLKSISTLHAADLQKFLNANVTADGAHLVICGDINAEAAFNLAEKYFGSWNTKANHPPLRAVLNEKRVLRTSIPLKDSRKSVICFGQMLPVTLGHSDYGDLLIADNILGNHPFISRLEQQLAKNPELEATMPNTDLSIKLEPLSTMSLWSLSLNVDHNSVPLWVKAIKQELRLLTKNGITQNELDESKRYLAGYLPLKTAGTLTAVSRSIIDAVTHNETTAFNAAQTVGVQSATVESVNKLIRTTFKPEQSTVIVAGSAQSIKAVHSQYKPANQQTKPAAN